MDGLTEGRIVHYVLPGDRKNAGQHRAAIVRQTFGGRCNLTVFLDGINDEEGTAIAPFTLLGDVYSAKYDPDGALGTWHWIERA